MSPRHLSDGEPEHASLNADGAKTEESPDAKEQTRMSSNVEISSGVTNSFGEDKDRLQFEHELFMQEVVSIRRRLREQLEAISAKRKLEKAAARKAKKATASVSNEDDVRGSDPKDAKGGEVEGEKDKGEESEQVSRVG